MLVYFCYYQALIIFKLIFEHDTWEISDIPILINYETITRAITIDCKVTGSNYCTSWINKVINQSLIMLNGSKTLLVKQFQMSLELWKSK